MENTPLNAQLSGLPPHDHSQPLLPNTMTSSFTYQPILTPVSTHQFHVSSETLSSDSQLFVSAVDFLEVSEMATISPQRVYAPEEPATNHLSFQPNSFCSYNEDTLSFNLEESATTPLNPFDFWNGNTFLSNLQESVTIHLGSQQNQFDLYNGNAFPFDLEDPVEINLDFQQHQFDFYNGNTFPFDLEDPIAIDLDFQQDQFDFYNGNTFLFN